MKHSLLLLAISAAIFTGCSTAYKAAQTPDDVYYSPAREVPAYVKTESSRDRYQENISYQDDRFLRMKVQNPNRWQSIDDYSYWYDSRFDYNMYNSNYYYNNRYAWNNWNSGLSYGNYFSPGYYGYGGYYSPVYPVIYYKNPRVYTGVTGKSNLATYMNSRYNNQNTNFGKGSTPSGNNFGNLVKKVFTNPTGNNGNTNSYDRPARTIEPSSTPSSSAGGRSGGYSSSGSSSSTPRPPRN
jgi:hypothetical protein